MELTGALGVKVTRTTKDSSVSLGGDDQFEAWQELGVSPEKPKGNLNHCLSLSSL